MIRLLRHAVGALVALVLLNSAAVFASILPHNGTFEFRSTDGFADFELSIDQLALSNFFY
jgi:hypothetical protein